MIRLSIKLLIAVLFLAPSLSIGEVHAAWLWSPESGKWTNVKDVPSDTPEEQFFIGKKYFDEADYDRAVDEFDKVIKHYPNSRWAAEAQFHRGVSYEAKKDIGKAAESYKNLVDQYPYSERLNETIKKEFELAESMLGGEKTKVLGMAIMPAQDTAVDLYKHIVKNAPYGPYGATAQFRLADAHLILGEFEEAERAYQRVIDEYPNSEYAPQAKYCIAKVSYDAALERDNDSTQKDAALNRFESFKKLYPESSFSIEADSAIQELRNKKALDLNGVATFYEERHKPKAAMIYYKELIEKFPETEYAVFARERVEHLEAIDRGETAQPKKILGLFPVGGETPEEKITEEPLADEAGKPNMFLGIIPIGAAKESQVQPEPEPEPMSVTESQSAPQPQTAQEPYLTQRPMTEEELVDTQKPAGRGSFLGLFPVGPDPNALPEAEPAVEEKPQGRPSFLGLFPVGPDPNAPEKVEEAKDADAPSGRPSFLGLFPVGPDPNESKSIQPAVVEEQDGKPAKFLGLF
jgi:outer membrane protein assembly factor BamD